MSFDALAWAGKSYVPSASEKLVLFALADRHNTENEEAWPSIEWIVGFTSLNRKTVIAALDRLEAVGLISDTGKRTGKTRSVKVYHLHLENTSFYKQSQKRDSYGSSTVFSPKQSQKRYWEPIKEPVAPSGSREPSVADDAAYAFEGATIRLSPKDFDQLAADFHGIPDLKAELVSIDHWFQDQPVEIRKRWWHSLKRMLNRKHQDMLKPKVDDHVDLLDTGTDYRREIFRG